MSSMTSGLVLRIQARMKALQPDNQVLRAAFTRIGILVMGETILNIRRKHIIDTGNLMSKIRYELFQEGDKAGVRIGSYGVKYAAVHEFGFHGTVSVRAHTRLMTQAFGHPVEARQIGVGTFRRQMNIRARPYLRPAVRSQTDNIVTILREAIASVG